MEKRHNDRLNLFGWVLANLFSLNPLAFQSCNWILKNKVLPFFSVAFYLTLWCLIESFYLLTQLLIFSIFSRQTRPSSLKPARHTTATDNQIRTQIRPPHSNTQETIIRPDHPIRPSDQQTTTATPDHQTRSHHRPQDAILDYSASNQHSKPNLLKWYRSGAFFMGWVEGGI